MNREGVDATKPVRAGEELDRAKLEAAIFAPVSEALGKQLIAPLDIQQFPSGHSNLTYLLRASTADEEVVELVARRPPFGNKVKTAHDMGREFRILSSLAGDGNGNAPYDKAPRPLFYTEDESIIGAPFYVMERITGVVLRRKVPAGVDLSPEALGGLATSFVDALVELHALPYREVGLGDLGKPEGYVERQVRGWAKRYEDAKTDDVPDVEAAAAWLASNLPMSPPPTLIHNDFKYDNLVLDPSDLTRIIGVLDWEMSTVGDPLMDLGTALAYWVEETDPDPIRAFAFGPTHLPGSPKRAEVARLYGEKTGADLSYLFFYYVFALFKNAVVAQQIYARYHRGLTQDERFAMMIMGVRLLGDAARKAIDTRSF